MNITKKFKNYTINCTAIQMGKDFNISIYGGDIEHIGAVALGVPRQSLKDKNKISSSVSLLTVLGHKEDVIVQRYAKILASKLNSTVVVCCGIHIDNINFEEINDLIDVIDEIINELIEIISLK